MPTLWIYFIVFAAVGTGIFVYAFRSLGPTRNAEKQVMELEDHIEEE